MSHNARKRTFGNVLPAKIQISLRIHRSLIRIYIWHISDSK